VIRLVYPVLVLFTCATASASFDASGDAGAEGQLENDCGLLALYTLMRIHGRGVGLAEIQKHLGPPGQGGVSMRALLDASEVLGLPLSAVRYEPGTPVREPALIFLSRAGRGHFMVVRPVGNSGELLQVSDGLAAPYVMEARKLYQLPYWHGLALVKRRSRLFTLRNCVFAALSLGIVASYLTIRSWLNRQARHGSA
jgi:Peptidase C39 family